MKGQVLDKMHKIWSRVSEDPKWEEYALALDIQSKVLHFSYVGPSYYWLLDTNNKQFKFISPEVVDVLGYPMEMYDLDFFFSLFHPDDVPAFLEFESTVESFFVDLPLSARFEYKIQYDFRFRKADGDYARILNQMIIVAYQDNSIHTLGLQTDISHLKNDNVRTLSFINLNGGKSFYGYKSLPFQTDAWKLSAKEKAVVKLLADGKTSKEIAEKLNIAKTTVDTHRKNILKKTGIKTTSQLISYAVANHWTK